MNCFCDIQVGNETKISENHVKDKRILKFHSPDENEAAELIKMVNQDRENFNEMVKKKEINKSIEVNEND